MRMCKASISLAIALPLESFLVENVVGWQIAVAKAPEVTTYYVLRVKRTIEQITVEGTERRGDLAVDRW